MNLNGGKEKRKKVEKRYVIPIYLSIFFLTLSLFIYEVLLTRLFSVILSNNMVFLVVSFAILGSGLGGIYGYVQFNKSKYNKSKKGENKRYIKDLVKISWLLPISIIGTIGIMYKSPYLSSSLIYIMIGMIPFIIGGAIISIIFKEYRENSNKLYFMDLIGAALGSLLVLKIMNSFGFMFSVVLTTILSMIGVILILIHYRFKKYVLINSFIVVILTALLIQGNFIRSVENGFTAYYSSPNTVIDYLRNSSSYKSLGISYSKWDAISRTDVLVTSDENEKIIVTDGAASAPILKFDGDLNKIAYLKKEVNYIPFAIGENKDALVIGSGGGKDVLFALLGGGKIIDAVEINGSSIDAVNKFKEFSGNIYGRPEVNVYNQDGRRFIENTKEVYDNIYLSMVMTNAVENNMFSLSENYLYTYEAFEEYFDHLKDQGKLSLMVHEEKEMIRIINTGIKVLLDRGIPQEEVTEYFTVINGVGMEHLASHGNMIMMPLVIFKNNPFTDVEIENVKTMANESKYQVIHYPGREYGPYKDIKENKITYKKMLKKFNVKVSPITDNSPFYYNYNSLVPNEIIILISGLMVIWLIISKVFFRKKEIRVISRHFIIIGLAYMLIEIPIVQKLSLYLENPSIAFSFVLFSILVSSGIGSALSGTKLIKKYMMESSIYLVVTGISVLTTLLTIDKVTLITNDFGLYGKFFVVFLTLLPMGTLMGMPFPTGINKVNKIKHSSNAIPLMWAANGIFSVIGSVLAVSLSMNVGFNTTIIIGGLCYLLLYNINPFKELGLK
ncbi:hypothetical protein [Oceanirhabdus sp. W0125-5]|uniref:hypothetical protein n=1 Tax=Oceanirhabdus sp. W0125-5 TaxID=2999116 RepID=UPI0022F2C1DC|nr:hypothetical protein [Oceanirhabdus sp. W0125-5]WBW95020.1 hypothetical protein OW730_15125 [Oceanirhabdus sp. W0125-5]